MKHGSLIFCHNVAALRFHPSIKRPQVTAQPKSKPRPSLPASSGLSDKQSKQHDGRSTASAAPAPRVGDSINDWIDEEADDYYVTEYQRHKQQQKEREKDAKKRHKKKRHMTETKEMDWNAPYDPEHPTQLALYKGSLEELDAKYEWKQRLHAHERKNKTHELQDKSKSMPPPADSNFRKCGPFHLLDNSMRQRAEFCCRCIRPTCKLRLCSAISTGRRRRRV